MPRSSSQQNLAHDVLYCNTIGQATNNMTSQEIERGKRFANAAETLQAILTHSKISLCQILHSRTGDCTPSCKIIDFSINFGLGTRKPEILQKNRNIKGNKILTNGNATISKMLSFEARFGRSPNTIWRDLVKLPSSKKP